MRQLHPEGSRTDAAAPSLIDRIAEAMRRVLVTHEHESAMTLWMENAVENFTDSETAVDNYTEAAQWSSDAEKVARELLAEYDASRNSPDAQVGEVAQPVAWHFTADTRNNLGRWKIYRDGDIFNDDKIIATVENCYLANVICMAHNASSQSGEVAQPVVLTDDFVNTVLDGWYGEGQAGSRNPDSQAEMRAALEAAFARYTSPELAQLQGELARLQRRETFRAGIAEQERDAANQRALHLAERLQTVAIDRDQLRDQLAALQALVGAGRGCYDALFQLRGLSISHPHFWHHNFTDALSAWSAAIAQESQQESP